MNKLTFAASLSFAAADVCKFPAPQAGFTQAGYSGVWFEIAKFQTAGGAFFEKDCVCTQLDVFYENTTYKVNNLCRQKTPSGKQSSAVATLTPSGPAGHFKESFAPLTPSVDYTIIMMGSKNGEEYSVEYDCSSNLTGTNYCVHFMSRTATMSDSLLQYLIAEVNALELNTQNLPLQMTKQENCWDQFL